MKEIRNWLDKNSTKNDPVDINRINFLGELGLQEEPRVMQLHVVDAATGKATPLTKGFRSFTGCHYAPDGSKLACTSEPDGTENP